MLKPEDCVAKILTLALFDLLLDGKYSFCFAHEDSINNIGSINIIRM